jgi:hypothetical protein
MRPNEAVKTETELGSCRITDRAIRRTRRIRTLRIIRTVRAIRTLRRIRTLRIIRANRTSADRRTAIRRTADGGLSFAEEKGKIQKALANFQKMYYNDNV